VGLTNQVKLTESKREVNMTRTNRRTEQEQLEYLEEIVLAAGGIRCRICGDVRQSQDIDKDMDCCDECAPYQRQLEREEKEGREEMWAHGHDHKNF
jgi:hypothetical protein